MEDMPFDRRNLFDLMFLFQDRLLRNIEQCFELLEVVVLASEQVCIMIHSEMNCR